MKKIGLLFVITFFVLFTLNSCEDRDGEKGNSSVPIMGTWKLLSENGEDASEENIHTVFSENGTSYNYKFEDGICVADATKYTTQGNILTRIDSENEEETATYSVTGDTLKITITDTESSETVLYLFKKTTSIPAGCSLGNDAELVANWTLILREEEDKESTDEEYIECQKSKVKINLNANGTFIANGFQYDDLTETCEPKNETGTWKTLNEKLIFEITGKNIIREFRYTIDGEGQLILENYAGEITVRETFE